MPIRHPLSVPETLLAEIRALERQHERAQWRAAQLTPIVWGFGLIGAGGLAMWVGGIFIGGIASLSPGGADTAGLVTGMIFGGLLANLFWIAAGMTYDLRDGRRCEADRIEDERIRASDAYQAAILRGEVP